YTVTQIAKELGMSGRELNRRLKALGIQFRLGGTWLLTARYQKEGYTRTHTHSWQSRCGETGTAMHTVWTEKGRLFIHCLFSSLSLF
ncbi:toxin Bro, partial [Phocaeicola vulgatus]